MKPLFALALIAPALSLAQNAPPALAAAADPAATAPVPVYRSALQGGPRGVVNDSADWKAANAEVGQFRRGHTDILKWEQSQGTAPAAKPQPAAPMPGRAMPMHRH